MSDKYTIVQHSGYGYAGKEGFARGLEVRTVSTKRLEAAVRRIGGLIFDSHREATDFEDKASFPNESVGIYPQAQGTFSEHLKVDGLAVYIPVREVKG